MSLEGCVVRMADTVSYVGRDIEDAIRLRLIRREELPPESVRVLGDTNGTIVFNLVTDILKNSHSKGYVAFSPEVSQALWRLKQFNLERIYLNPRMKPHTAVIRGLFRRLFEEYLGAIDRRREESVIFRGFLNGMSPDYIARHRPAEVVRDFIAGMTDSYFIEQCPPHLRPAYLQSGE
jgi:dGTPase